MPTLGDWFLRLVLLTTLIVPTYLNSWTKFSFGGHDSGPAKHFHGMRRWIFGFWLLVSLTWFDLALVLWGIFFFPAAVVAFIIAAATMPQASPER